MNPEASRLKKSPSSKARRKPESGWVRPVAPKRSEGGSTSRSTSKPGGSSVLASCRQIQPKRLVSSLASPAAAGRPDPAALRREFRAWRASLPTALERDTLLMPDAIAESGVQEAERFLEAELPANFAERLAAKAYHLYPRHKHFKKMLNRCVNYGRDLPFMYMRHWTASWLKRERSALYKKLPRSYAPGQRLPVAAPGVPKHYPDAKKLVKEDCIKPSQP